MSIIIFSFSSKKWRMPMDTVEFVKKLLKDRRIPLSRIEKDLGFSNGYIGRLRKGFFPPDRLSKIAEYLNVSEEFLLSCGVDVSTSARSVEISDDEHELLSAFRQLDTYDRGQALGIIKGLLLTDKYKKAEPAACVG